MTGWIEIVKAEQCGVLVLGFRSWYRDPRGHFLVVSVLKPVLLVLVFRNKILVSDDVIIIIIFVYL